MKNLFKILVFSFLIIGFFTNPARALGTASLTISPASQSVAAGQTVTLNINLNTGGAATTGVDAIITFNPAVLGVTSVNWGSLYSTPPPAPVIDNAGGKLTLRPGVISSAYAYTGTGVLASIVFTAKAAGTSTVAFTCTNGVTQNDTNVWSGSNDIISCTDTTGGSYTVISTPGATATPIPTATPTPTTNTGTNNNTNATATPTPGSGTLMEAGATGWTFLLLTLGIVFTFGGVKLLLAKNS